MTQINANNFAKVTGRLTRDPIFFDNANGSKTVKLTLAYSEEFVRNGQTEPQARYVDLTGYVPEGSGEGAYAYVVRGSKVSIFYEPYTQVFTRGGKTVYDATNEIKSVILEESKAETAARRKRNADGAAAGGDAAAPATDPVEQTAYAESAGPFG
ncbi:single-stranded DNA-binding protein [Rhodococcus sp. NCIMB 12038]|uniref:single-stranded DNA-binding protein n=1 Tax=Rhodococcus sp. NCIMB 12038 TaxID=933800 RepID=UPI000B3BE7FF|nr:single-stranded DNA-binding protein [Rhodococcus sp. NCIMB 12038]OUS97426.1 hypothetical protein CA951_03535 [Rhodococcus sp. NCIMB 12038]